MGASDHTRDPSPGASRQTFRCAGGTPLLIGNSSQIGRLAAYPPHPLQGAACRFSTRCAKRDMSSNRHRIAGCEEGPKRMFTRCDNLARTRCAGWEEAARPQGLFPSYACRNGRGARDLHEIAYGIVPEEKGSLKVVRESLKLEEQTHTQQGMEKRDGRQGDHRFETWFL